MINENFIYLGVFIQLIGGLIYLFDTVTGKIQPNKVSWFMWCIAPFVAFTAEISQGVGIQSLATFITGFVPLLVFTGSFFNRKAAWKVTKFDLLCGTLSFAGLFLWYITNVGNIAIFFAIMADALAALPTIIKSFFEPESESDSAYLLGLPNAAIGLLVLKKWTFQGYGFPLYLFIIQVIIVFFIRTRIGEKLTNKKSL